MRGALLAVGVALALAVPAVASPKVVPIHEGVGIGRVALGTSATRIVALGGRCIGSVATRRCALDGAYATFDPSGGAFVVSTTSRRARTSRGVGVGTRLAAVRARYGRALVRLGVSWVLLQPAASTAFTVARGVVATVTVRRVVAPAIAYAGLRLTEAAPGVVYVSGAAPGDALRVRLTLGAHTFDLAAGLVDADGAGRVALTRSVVADALAADGLVGDQAATVEATLAFPTTVTRRFAIVVEGLAPDPLVLAGPPRGLVRPGDTLVPLRIDGIRPAGPPIEVRFTDCLDVEHIISIPRTEASATVSLDPGSVVRTTLEAACVTPVVSPIVDFQVGLNVAGRFEPAATLVELSFLP